MRQFLPLLTLTGLLLLRLPSPLESQSLPRLTIGDVTVREGRNDTTIVLPIRLDRSSTNGVQFSYATVDGSATSRADYRAQSGSTGLSAGTTNFELNLVVTGDTKVEGTESFMVRLTGVVGAELAKSTGTITILDGDQASSGDGQPGAPGGTGGGETNGGSLATAKFQDLFDAHKEKHERQMAGVLDRTCGTAQGEHKRLCTFLSGMEPKQRAHTIRALIPRGMPAQGDATLRSQQPQLANVSARQGQLRASIRNDAVGGALNQMTAEFGGRAIPLDAVTRALRAPTDQESLAKAIDRQLEGLRKEPKQDDDLDPEPSRTLREGGEGRLGFFANGRFGDSKHDGTALEPGYRVDNYGGTAGVDHKLGTKGWLGAALGYSDSTTKLDDWDYKVKLDGYSLSLYSGFQIGRFYVDGAVSHGQLDFAVSRKIELPVAFDNRKELTASGKSDSEFSSASVSTGYDRTLGRLGVSTFVRGFYSEATVDAFEETGAGGFSLTFEKQSIDSGLVEAGFELSLPISLSWGALHPIFRASYLRETGDDSREISTRFVLDTQNERFLIETDEPDRDYLSGTIGFHLTLSRGRLLYLMAERHFERDDFEQSMFLFGYRQQIR